MESKALEEDQLRHEADVAPPRAVPVGPRERERLVGVDVARGFALLGIFLVNIDYFALPLGASLQATAPAGELLDQGAWWLVRTLCLGKFYPLFSMLFGIGLVLQMASIEERGGRFVPLYLRRTLLLMALGLAHALLIWYGDILFIYSFCALVLLACSRFRARTLFILAGLLAAAALVLVIGMTALGLALGDDGSAAPEAVAISPPEAADASPFREWTRHLSEVQEGPADPWWMELETRAYRDGALLDIAGFRAVSFVGMLFFMLIGGGWHVLAMFLLGAALCRAGLLEATARARRRRLLVIALMAGLPLALLAAAVQVAVPGEVGLLAGGAINLLAGPLVALAYLLLWLVVTEAGLWQLLTRWLAAAGRMALSNYLAQSVVASALTQYWGLGLFGSLDAFERIALVLLVFALQVAASVWWLSRWRFGPLEWLWRSATYGRRQPMRRRAASPEAA
jgi:uncharacterized protein